MRKALIVAGVAAAVALGWTLVQATGDGSGPLASQTADAGGVEVEVVPVRLDQDGALFEVALDTHTVDLDAGLSSTTELLVDATPWGPARWQGDPAGGHHREGRLVFDAQGPATGAVQLTIDGLPSPVIFVWDLEQP